MKDRYEKQVKLIEKIRLDSIAKAEAAVIKLMGSAKISTTKQMPSVRARNIDWYHAMHADHRDMEEEKFFFLRQAMANTTRP